MKKGYVYILSNFKRKATYIGVTNDIERRVLEHKAGIGSVHTSKYQLKFLMYFETYPHISDAIAREKQLKDWKWNLIKKDNPNLVDLAADWFKHEEISAVIGRKR